MIKPAHLYIHICPHEICLKQPLISIIMGNTKLYTINKYLLNNINLTERKMSQLRRFGESLSKMDGYSIIVIWKSHRTLIKEAMVASSCQTRQKIVDNVTSIQTGEYSFLERIHIQLASFSILGFKDEAELKQKYNMSKIVKPLSEIFGLFFTIISTPLVLFGSVILLSYLKDFQLVATLQGHINAVFEEVVKGIDYLTSFDGNQTKLNMKCISNGLSTKVISLFTIGLLSGSFFCLCLCLIKRLYITLIFTDSHQLAEINTIVFQENNRLRNEGHFIEIKTKPQE